MLERDPSKRLTIREVVKHDWVTSNGLLPLDVNLDENMQEPSSQENEEAFSKIHLITRIKMKMRNLVHNEV